MIVSGGRADKCFFLFLSYIVLSIQLYAQLEKGIALQTPNPQGIHCAQEKGLLYGQQRQPLFHAHQQADASTSSWLSQ